MNVDTYYFFLIILGGFTTVWSFRKYSHSKHSIGDFEYLGFSSIWGVLLLVGYSALTKNHPENFALFVSIPFLAGLFLSAIGFVVGMIGGKIWKKLFR